MQKNLFVYIDPGFLSGAGHYHNFATRIHDYIHSRDDIDIVHYVGKSASKEDIATFGLKPLFDYPASIDTERLSFYMIWIRLQAFRRRLRTVFKEVEDVSHEYAKIVFYMYTSHPIYFIEFAKQQKKTLLANIEYHLVLFYLDNQFCQGVVTKGYKRLLEKVSKTLMAYDATESIRIHIDSDKAVELYQPYFSMTISPLPIPLHTAREMSLPKQTGHKEQPCIGYFGYMTYKHGFHLIHQLYNTLTVTGLYRFMIRVHRFSADPKISGFIDTFKEASDVTVVDDYVDEETYTAMINSCDVIVIPYLKSAYPVQTSGVFIDAVMSGKRVVAAEGTWMGEKVKLLKNGATFCDGDADALRQAVAAAFSMSDPDPDTMRRFSEFYTVEKLFEVLIPEQ